MTYGVQHDTRAQKCYTVFMNIEPALYLIPVTLGETDIDQVLPAQNHDIIVNIKHFIVENIRSARRFLKKVEKIYRH